MYIPITPSSFERCIDQGVTDQDARLVQDEETLAGEDYATDTIGVGRDGLAVEFTDILMSTRCEVVSVVLVDAEMKLCTMLDDGLVERRKEYVILLVKLRNWSDKQTMVLACIASCDRG